MRRTLTIFACVLTTPIGAQTSKAEREFERHRTKVLAEAAQRHLRLGSWCHENGLVRQGTAQFLLAKEVGQGTNPGAVRVAAMLKNLGDAFWSKHRKDPSRRLLARYDRRARDLRKKDTADRFGLARWAHQRRLEDRALGLYESLLRDHDGPIEFDQKGRIPLQAGTIPTRYAERFRERSIRINGAVRVRDRVLAELPAVRELFEHGDDALLVQSRISREHAEKLHTMLVQLLPHLETAVGGKPTRRLRVFVFEDRKLFDGYLDRAGYGKSKAAGLTDPANFVALVDGDGRAPALVQAIALHELTHLFEYGVGPVVFPSWYTEGFAETYGGFGTFALEDDELTVGGRISDSSVRILKGGLIPLDEFLKTDAMKLIAKNHDRAVAFYAQSWAFLRYLRTAAGDDVAATLRDWERRCRGGGAGVRSRNARGRDQQPATLLFYRLFGQQLDELETGFRAWVERL